jgi:hypothetical protein
MTRPAVTLTGLSISGCASDTDLDFFGEDSAAMLKVFGLLFRDNKALGGSDASSQSGDRRL